MSAGFRKAWPLAALVVALPAAAQELGSVAGWQSSKPAGCMVWVAEMPPGGAATWSGTCIDHQATGPGTVTVRKGDREGTSIPASIASAG